MYRGLAVNEFENHFHWLFLKLNENDFQLTIDNVKRSH
ncbi:hypothetical protein KIS4809_5501 [Bacillus sp. ZZV12-4809]|nr:hypothetical protein KIS4809_5501 [Bacillus sp. ZZV12-4809]